MVISGGVCWVHKRIYKPYSFSDASGSAKKKKNRKHLKYDGYEDLPVTLDFFLYFQ